MTDLPTWCTPPPRLLGRDAEIRRARDVLRTGPVNLVGPGGVGATVTGGALLDQLRQAGHAVAAVRVDGDTSRPDLVLALGLALGATLPGDETSVLEVLQREPAPAVLLDDADLAPDATQHVLALAPDALWILTGRDPVLGETVSLPLLPDELIASLVPAGRDPATCHGRPLLARMPARAARDNDWGSDTLREFPELALLVELPMGLHPTRGYRELPAWCVDTIEGHVVPRRSLRETLGLDVRATPAALARVVADRAQALHHVACDLVAHTDLMDLRLLRAAARSLEEPSLAAVAAAAAARMHIRAFQASEALDLVRERLVRDRPPPVARGLLRWLEGDALLTQGSHDLAHEAHLSAAADLRGHGAARARIALARRCADEWVARGDPNRAQRWLSLARAELGRQPDPRALADTLRISGNLAAQAGELVGAGALYDQALATLAGDSGANRERAFIRLGQAAMAMARRRFGEAREALEQAHTEAASHPLAEASVAWRQAELALRQGHREPARAALARATDGFRQSGALRGLLLCARMEGDLAAVSGDRLGAVRAWQQATNLCVRTRNLAGLQRLLRRRLVVEREGMPGPHVEELQRHLDLAEVLLRVG